MKLHNKLCVYKQELEAELIRILDYWANNTVDHDRGGFLGQRDHHNKLIKDAGKGAVLNARILWSFSAAYRYTKNQEHLRLAERAFDYMKEHFIDKEHGGLIWEVDSHGNPTNTRKQIYAQGFGIYGFSEYFMASEDGEGLELAKSLFSIIEEHSFDNEYGGYLEAVSRDWKPLEDMRLSEKDANYPKSMNTHLHILEPYTNLYRIWKNDELAQKIRLLIRTFLDHIINHETAHFNLFFELNWEVKSDIVSFGHDIEGTWLLTEAAEELGDQEMLKEVQEIAIKMTIATILEGMDNDGGLFYEQEPDHLDTDKHWWPQTEAMVGLLNAYQISGNEKYLQKSMDCWEFVKKNLLDKKHGEWYWRVNRDGVPYENEDKAGFWKCPYHNSRACLEVLNRLKNIGIS